MNVRLSNFSAFLKREKTAVKLFKTAAQAWATGLLLGVIGFAIYQIAPVYIKSYQLEDAAKKAARLASTNWQSEGAIQDAVYEKAQALGLPVDRQKITVASAMHDKPVSGIVSLVGSAAEPATMASVNIDVSYAVPVDFPGHTFYLRFHFHADERSA